MSEKQRTGFDKSNCMAVRDMGKLAFVCGNPNSNLNCIYKEEDVAWVREDGSMLGSSCVYGINDGRRDTLCISPEAQNEAIFELFNVLRKNKEAKKAKREQLPVCVGVREVFETAIESQCKICGGKHIIMQLKVLRNGKEVAVEDICIARAREWVMTDFDKMCFRDIDDTIRIANKQ